MILSWLCMGAALAGDVTPWVGEWGLDPARSDDPYDELQRAIQAPLLSAGGASQYAPDGGADNREEDQRKLVTATMALLGLSGRIGVQPDGEGMLLTFGGEDPVELDLGRKWTRFKTDDGTLRLRAEADELLVVERRVKNAVLTETFLRPEEPRTLLVVVRIDGSGIDGLEFRRVYRALHEAATSGGP